VHEALRLAQLRSILALAAIGALVLAAGCGGSEGPDSATLPDGAGSVPSGKTPEPLSSREYRGLAGTICQSIVVTFSSAGTSEKQAAVRARALENVLTQLAPLPAPAGLRAASQRLLRGLGRLHRLYVEKSRQSPGEVDEDLAQAIGSTEAIVAGTAAAIGVPACAPHAQ
jgi:hypothetical protein